MEIEQNQLQTPDIPAETVTSDDGGGQTRSYEPPTPTPTPPAQAESEQSSSDSQHWKDDKRSEIFSRAKEKRQGGLQPFSGDPNEPTTMYGAAADQSEMGDLEREALRKQKEYTASIDQKPQPKAGQPQAKTLNGLDPGFLAQPVPIIVDGQQRTVPIEELVRNYQIDQAANRRLEHAKALLQHTQEFQRLQQPIPGQQAEYEEQQGRQEDSTSNLDDNGQADGNTSRQPANIKDLVEKIQLGSPDEAAQALEEFVSSAVNRGPQVDETTRVLTALEDLNAKQAVTAFAERFPQVAANPMLQAETTRQIYRQMAIDLVNSGYSTEDLHRLAPSTQQLTQLHKQARINGLKGVRRVQDIMEAGYHGAIGNLRELVEQTNSASQAQNPAPGLAARQQRKESLQPQPAARRLSSSMSAAQPQRTIEQSRSAAVERMRKARGQSV